MKSFVSVLCLLVSTTAAFAPVRPSTFVRPTVAARDVAVALKFPWNKKEEGSIALLEPPSVEEKEAVAGAEAAQGLNIDAADEECVVEEELTETEKLLKQVKDAGVAGFISYAAWEWAFWIVSVPVCVLGYYQVAGHWPDFSSKEDMAKVGAEAFAFVNFARFAVPLRIGLALSTTPWIQENIVDRFFSKNDENVCEEPKE
uniref:DUF1279 domain-containing protein n=1 Tax=Pseudictyota dubia TaxID=2749911 RepID=A0A7R9WF11_9STRA|mmetsp:Transcript_47388/g.87996  ORF Transcript_47388/g.87996 Transcript_47388/m.87996 type:complete len:201 (+) Transcript_47388:225-827(+)|eukprot:CAMPEP_0197439808 /NCGR_PEP_ID=MMETSP1175-20131217/6467_1 /TAXON_ID=1003142 /ORGANISM="Triceratium dubium, Strain CCMP147" /LENGTH=200 /DNA_ID=CAMNT_0042969793 /DNA_START=84 /DNA_END=686 /DNA_ORIENTATION=-